MCRGPEVEVCSKCWRESKIGVGRAETAREMKSESCRWVGHGGPLGHKDTVIRIYAIEVWVGKVMNSFVEHTSFKGKTPKAQLTIIFEKQDPGYPRVEQNTSEGLSCCLDTLPCLSKCVTAHPIFEDYVSFISDT